jgi:hypothetical protein
MIKAILINADATSDIRIQKQLEVAGWSVDVYDTIFNIPENHSASLLVLVRTNHLNTEEAVAIAEQVCGCNGIGLIVTNPNSILTLRPDDTRSDHWLVDEGRKCALLLQDQINSLFMDVAFQVARTKCTGLRA